MFLRKVTNRDYSLEGGVGAFVMLALNKVLVVGPRYTLYFFMFKLRENSTDVVWNFSAW
jgi:hypothetical protein